MTRFLISISGILAVYTSATLFAAGAEEARTVEYAPINVQKIREKGTIFRAQSPSPPARFLATQNTADRILQEPPGPPVEVPPDLALQRQLQNILQTSQKESAGQTPATETPAQTATQGPPKSESPATTTPITGASTTGAGLVATEMAPGKTPKSFFATLKDGTILAVTKTDQGYYDENDREVIYLADDEPNQLNSTLLIILACCSTFAAIYIGFIAVDYQRRLEQALSTQNQRYTSSGDSLSSDVNSWEPETLRFSASSLSSLDSLDSGSSFRTIA